MKLKEVGKKALKEIEKATTLKGLNKIWKKYLGKKGELKKIFNSLKKLSPEKRKVIGKKANLLRKKLEEVFEKRKRKLEREYFLKVKRKKIDISRPGLRPEIGHLHPLTLTIRRAVKIFSSMGFEIVEGPEIENEWYNFDALNIPKDHPARDLWDTLWLKLKKRLLLRTHTSPVQIRYMEKVNPPLKIISAGRVFRHEATDASHEINFYQLEGLMVDEKISVANFKEIIREFFNKFFEKKIEMRLRPSYFPFTEPSFEIDISCPNCQKKGCSICQKKGWIEIMGAGMVHPKVFKNARLNPQGISGFAFGLGIDRLAMIRYKIDDIRLFYKGDLRFIHQF